MKKSLLILSLLFIFNSYLIAQITSHSAQYNASVFMEHIDRLGSNNLDYLNDLYKGTPYNNPIFLLGTIYEDNKTLATNYALRYNAMADEIEIKETLYVEDSEIKSLTKSPNLHLKIMNDLFIFVLANETIENAGYFQVLQVGNKYSLYKKIAKKYYPAKKAKNSFETDVLARFEDRSIYYLVSTNNKFQEFESSKSKKLKVFESKESEIKKYIKNGRLDINDENDLIKIVNYYDSISYSK